MELKFILLRETTVLAKDGKSAAHRLLLPKTGFSPRRGETKHGHHHPRPSYCVQAGWNPPISLPWDRAAQVFTMRREGSWIFLSLQLHDTNIFPSTSHSFIHCHWVLFFYPFSVLFFFFLYIDTTRRTGTGLCHIEWLAYSP